MFRALFAHHQEALHLKQLVYFVRIMSAGFGVTNPGSCQPTKYAQSIPIFVYVVPPDDEQIVIETCTAC
jgi:hypothetical protein